MSLFPPIDDNSLYFSMYSKEESWSRYVIKPFYLDEMEWQSVEHYYQAMKFDSADYREKIRQAETPEKAAKLGNARFKRKRSDWKAVQTVVMTRAVYTQCHTYSEMTDDLLATEDQRLVEDSQFDYFWGCGRDRRGKNHFGQVLMNVRTKLRQESEEASASKR